MSETLEHKRQKYGDWYEDAVAILHELGAGKTAMRRGALGKSTLPALRNGLSVLLYSMLHGIWSSDGGRIYSIEPLNHPFFEYLKARLTQEQFNAVVRHKDMTRLEFSALCSEAKKC